MGQKYEPPLLVCISQYQFGFNLLTHTHCWGVLVHEQLTHVLANLHRKRGEGPNILGVGSPFFSTIVLFANQPIVFAEFLEDF